MHICTVMHMSELPASFDHAPAAWRGRTVEPSSYVYALDGTERSELERALDRLSRERPALDRITKDAYPMPAIAQASARIRREIERGLGFVLVRGVPLAPRDDAGRLYWLLGLHLGSPVPQNVEGEILCDVKDTGANPEDPETRLYTTTAEQDFHTDGADIIGLLCLATGASGGASRLVSSVRVFEEVRRRRPDLAPLLFEPWHFRLVGRRGDTSLPSSFEIPICRFNGRSLATFFIPWYIRRAQLLPEVPRLGAARTELLALYEEVANDPALTLDMQFEPGDVQWLKNSVILHKRTAYEDSAEKKRHLLRLWLAAPPLETVLEDGDEMLRRGFARGDHAAR
jgi:hypothetical protein